MCLHWLLYNKTEEYMQDIIICLLMSHNRIAILVGPYVSSEGQNWCPFVLMRTQAQAPTDVVNLFGGFFGSVYTARSDQTFDFEAHRTITGQISSEVSEEEVRKLISDLDVSKSAGPDGLSPQFYKSTITATTKPLTLIFRSSLSSHRFPELWKRAVVTPVFKSGDRSDVRNYRPISILSCAAKLLDNLNSIRLESTTHRLPPNND